ncbi:MAG: GAF domain-containing sensor histidine kinase [Chloroflexi bacterium]|nr:GAF domain-containing sensor histidine kinase [Chloroflexota bacterium]
MAGRRLLSLLNTSSEKPLQAEKRGFDESLVDMDAAGKTSLSPLKWVAIVVPVLLLIAFDYVRHFVLPFSFLHGWSGLLIVWTMALAGVAVFILAIFAVMGKMERDRLRHYRELAAPASVASALGHSLKLEQILSVALDKVMKILDVQGGTVCVLDESRRELEHLAHRGIPPELLGPLNRVKLDGHFHSSVVETGEPAVIEDLWEDPQVGARVRERGFRSLVVVPLSAEGKVVGVMALASTQKRLFSPSLITMLTSIGNQLGMAVRNAVLFQDQVRRSKEFAVLNAISSAVSSSLDLKEVMVAAIDRVLDLMEAEAGEIWLLEESGQELTLAIHRGLFPEGFHEVERFPIGLGLPGLVTQAGEPVICQNLSRDERFLRQSVKDKGFQFLACLPLKSKGRVVGTMSIASLKRHDLSSRDIELLVSAGNQIGVAIENASLHRKVQAMAILEERERIAREMHDGVAQVLGYVNAKTLAARRLLSLGKLCQAEEALGQLDEAAREVYADVREAIVGLRATTSSSRGLIPTVREYSEWFSRQNMIQVEFAVEGLSDDEVGRAAELQLIRIVQEALNNVRKHAQAQRAWVRLSATNGQVHLTLRDDGHGFNPERVARGPWPQFGLQTMRERAESIGGTFGVSSAPGRGTEVKVEVPKGACLS